MSVVMTSVNSNQHHSDTSVSGDVDQIRTSVVRQSSQQQNVKLRIGNRGVVRREEFEVAQWDGKVI